MMYSWCSVGTRRGEGITPQVTHVVGPISDHVAICT
jgi:hypothetical protein